MSKIQYVAIIYPGPRVIIYRQDRPPVTYHPTLDTLGKLIIVLDFRYTKCLALLRSSQRGMLTVFHILYRPSVIQALREGLRGFEDHA